MPSAVSTIRAVRDSVCALLRLTVDDTARTFYAVLTGTTWCVVQDEVFVTAQHVLNDSKPRDPTHKFFVVHAPGNGPTLQFWPVTRFLLEDSLRDLAVFEAPVQSGSGIIVPSVPVALSPPADGTSVVTYGYPAPVVTSAQVGTGGVLTSLHTALFTHGAVGIIAAQYPLPTGDTLIEFDVAWHHGESGGPIFELSDTPVAFSVMQRYRIIQGASGPMDGPRQGIALTALGPLLSQLGATVVP